MPKGGALVFCGHR